MKKKIALIIACNHDVSAINAGLHILAMGQVNTETNYSLEVVKANYNPIIQIKELHTSLAGKDQIIFLNCLPSIQDLDKLGKIDTKIYLDIEVNEIYTEGLTDKIESTIESIEDFVLSKFGYVTKPTGTSLFYSAGLCDKHSNSIYPSQYIQYKNLLNHQTVFNKLPYFINSDVYAEDYFAARIEDTGYYSSTIITTMCQEIMSYGVTSFKENKIIKVVNCPLGIIPSHTFATNFNYKYIGLYQIFSDVVRIQIVIYHIDKNDSFFHKYFLYKSENYIIFEMPIKDFFESIKFGD